MARPNTLLIQTLCAGSRINPFTTCPLALTALAHLGILKRFRMRRSYDWQQDLAAHSTGSLQNVRVMQGNNRIGLCDTSRLGRLCGPELRNGTGFFSSA